MPCPRLQWAATDRPEIQLPIVEQNFSKEEQGNEMTGLFTRGCLKKVKRSELPMGTRVISSRFHDSSDTAGEHKLKVERLKV
jgi:hypothetical protein